MTKPLTYVTSSSPVQILQITEEIFFGLEVSASLVIPMNQWRQNDALPLPQTFSSFDMYLLLVASTPNSIAGNIKVENTPTSLTPVPSLNASYYSAKISDAIQGMASLFFNTGEQYEVGGQLHAVGDNMAFYYPIAFNVMVINDVCVVTTGTPDDGIDNDCDGDVDEEQCTEMDLIFGADDDSDGMLNEDCRVPDVEISTSEISLYGSPTETYFLSEAQYSEGFTTSYQIDATATITTTTTAPVNTAGAGTTSSSTLFPNTPTTPVANTGTTTSSSSILLATATTTTTTTPAVGAGTTSSSTLSLTSTSTTAPVNNPGAGTTSSTPPVAAGATSSSTLSPTTTSTTAPVNAPGAGTTTSSMRVKSSTSYVTSYSSTICDSCSTSAIIEATSTIVTEVVSPSPKLCSCQCPSNVITAPLESSEIASMTSSIQKELIVDKNEVSATKRKFISVTDDRPSAQTVGYFGICVFALTFGGIFLLDFTSLAKDVLNLVKDCKSPA